VFAWNTHLWRQRLRDSGTVLLTELYVFEVNAWTERDAAAVCSDKSSVMFSFIYELLSCRVYACTAIRQLIKVVSRYFDELGWVNRSADLTFDFSATLRFRSQVDIPTEIHSLLVCCQFVVQSCFLFGVTGIPMHVGWCWVTEKFCGLKTVQRCIASGSVTVQEGEEYTRQSETKLETGICQKP
jgi:hypothetical protein